MIGRERKGGGNNRKLHDLCRQTVYRVDTDSTIACCGLQEAESRAGLLCLRWCMYEPAKVCWPENQFTGVGCASPVFCSSLVVV